MNEARPPINGEANHAPATLESARTAFCEALLASIRTPDGQLPVNALELLLNSHLDGVRISALADTLTAAGVIEPADLAARTIAKLQERTAHFQRMKRHVIT